MRRNEYVLFVVCDEHVPDDSARYDRIAAVKSGPVMRNQAKRGLQELVDTDKNEDEERLPRNAVKEYG